MDVPAAAVLLLTAGYALFVLSVFAGAGRLKPGRNTEQPPVTILVAARNEENNIAPLLDALFAQNYPKDKLDIIVVNDRSEDRTREIALSYTGRGIPLTVIDAEEIPEGFSPKKYALTLGVNAARGEIVCATDADCLPPAGWVSAMVRRFEPDVGFVAGFSPLHVRGGSTFFADYLYIDALALAIVAAGGIGIQSGWTCAGRNLAYRTSVFDEVGGYADVSGQISGDDDLLMHLVQKKTAWKLGYAFGPDAAVPSVVLPGVSRYVGQRTRHASKFRAFPLRVKCWALVVFLFYGSFFLYPAGLLFSVSSLPVWLAMLGVKFSVELAAMVRGSRKLAGLFSFGTFLKAFFLHPVLIVVFSIRGARGKFTWKDRKFQQT